MKKLFLLPVIALIAVMAVSIVSAATYYCCNDPLGGCHNSCDATCCDKYEGSAVSNTVGYISCTSSVDSCTKVPEFTSLGMGIALIGASAGYALIRRKRK